MSEHNQSMSSKGKLKFVTASELLSMDIPKPQYLLEGIIEAQSLIILAGEAGCGKSMFVTNLALAIAAGRSEWLGCPVKKKGIVLYLNNELGLSALRHRIEMMKTILTPFETFSNLMLTGSFPPPIKACYNDLAKYCEKYKPALVIVDSLYFALDEENENDSNEMRKLMRDFAWLRDRFKCTIMIVHHVRKGSGSKRMHMDDIRGSSVFVGAVDTAIMLRRSGTEDGRWILQPIKFRNQPDTHKKPIAMSLDEKSLWFKNEEMRKETEHTNSGEFELNFPDIFGIQTEMQLKEIILACEPLGCSVKTIQRALEDGVKVGKLIKIRHGVYRLV